MPKRESGSTGTLPATSAEMSRLLTAVRRGRVLTVTGGFREPRSLLVREIARRLASNFYDGVAVVALDPLHGGHGGHGVRELTAELGRVPGMPFLPCGTANAASWLAERDMLLVLDGAEQLAPAALAWLRDLLSAAPGLRILAAARSPLAFEQERVHRL
ncbi:hypothetical protein [Streptomyces sp. ISL-94]|uniref:hypothetical protein n=1 Tax=Streptomyces sp. ISL-94 TaxID=2819190 RepID=UPI001BE82DC3|nr:hypothetical protein [Streptomyces sp. ISL-94]MBT2481417.1 hypothetical protein [Streptomyces sp. ISL-94]